MSECFSNVGIPAKREATDSKQSYLLMQGMNATIIEKVHHIHREPFDLPCVSLLYLCLLNVRQRILPFFVDLSKCVR